MYHIRKWNSLAEKQLRQILDSARKFPYLTKLGPKRVPKVGPDTWSTEVEVVGSMRMSRLNATFRGKNHPTDVLSFPSPPIFRKAGQLGSLVICLPTLQRQAKQLGHSPATELEVLLVHGVLHLLGFDHENSPSEARMMAKWEAKLLKSTFSRGSGLIQRSDSGIEEG